MRYTNIKKFIVTSFVLLSFSCITITPAAEYEREHNIEKSKPKVTKNENQNKLVNAALRAVAMEYSGTLKFSGRSFSNDCSGLIYGIFWEADIDIISHIIDEKGNGVKRLYTALNKKGLIHRNKYPEPGDLVFWDNTYGTWGSNALSHIGIVVSVDNKGNIEYVHNNTYLGAIRKERMNLFKPKETRPVNNYMRYDDKYQKTAGELFNAFGSAWKL